MKIITASLDHLDQLIPLFDGYRKFYKQDSDSEAAKTFLGQRIKNNESIIFLAIDDENRAMGFTQLYPTFSSVSLQGSYILNDLFVSKNYRGQGIGELLLNHAKQYVVERQSKGLTLETDYDNPAQFLYERLGWKKETKVFHYSWKV